MRGHFIYLSPISQSLSVTNCSLCNLPPVLSRRRKSLRLVWLSAPGGVSSVLIWEWFHGPLLTCSVFIWLPQITNLASSCGRPMPGSLSFTLGSRAGLFARCLPECPSRELSSLLFIWLNYEAGFAWGEGMSDTSLEARPPILLRHQLYACQLFLH